jgi:Skp family chaperone for outer membrane proteins
MFSNMKKVVSLVTVGAAVTAAAFAQSAATGASTAPATGAAATPAAGVPATTKVGVIDIRRVIAATNEGRRDYETLIKKFEPKQKEVDGLKAEVQQLQDQLKAAKDLSDGDRAARVRTIEQKQKNLERVAEDAQNDFQAQQQEIIGRIGNKLMDVVDKYARNNGFSMVIDANAENPGPVLWASENVNISQAVLDAYNAQSGVAAPAANARSANRPAATTPSRPATTTNPAAKKPAPTGTTPPKQ